MGSEWIDVKDNLPDGPGAIVDVKLKNGDMKKAYYHRDKMIWSSFYTREKTSHFQCFETLKSLYDVTHYKE
jgi:hypothetical protein